MHRFWTIASLLVLLCAPAWMQAGLYYSGEQMAELPSQWRGFLLDQRSLRTIAVTPKKGTAASPLREQYLKKADELEKTRESRKLTPGELADLGAIYIRLGQIPKAIVVLRQAQRKHPNHFQIAANLGTAWQLHGDLQQAITALEQAVRLAPGKWLQAEKYHLKLVRLRLREPKGNLELDDLFGVRYVGENGEYEVGKIAAKEKKKLPAKAVAIMQQLCLWFPADARLLWQLAELANAYGDIRYAANMMDGCVTQFGLPSRTLRRHRRVVRSAAAKLPKATIGSKTQHKTHIGGLPARSKRPLLTKLDQSALPDIDPDAINRLPWPLLNETEMDRKYRPTFAKYLKGLEGKSVTLTGFMQPFRDELDVNSFMLIEYPVGCWYCEMPELTGIILVETPRGQTARYTRSLVRITGELSLNDSDPEEFLYAIRNAKVGSVD